LKTSILKVRLPAPLRLLSQLVTPPTDAVLSALAYRAAGCRAATLCSDPKRSSVPA